jgi:hypothetical protein
LQSAVKAYALPPRHSWNKRYNIPLQHLRARGADGVKELLGTTSVFAPRPFADYVESFRKEPTYFSSRLQMYWRSRFARVILKGPVFVGGEGAPAARPTVRFPGTRDKTTQYICPTLEQLLPYMDDPRGIQVVDPTTREVAWAPVVQTGHIVQEINLSLLKMASLAGLLYEITSVQLYAQFALQILEVYLGGILACGSPLDITRGHQQTIVGLTAFEVIQEESSIVQAAITYAFIYDAVFRLCPETVSMLDSALKKWMDWIIRNGVPFNNWNFVTARTVLQAAASLRGNEEYEDGKGALWYADEVMYRSSVRQWSLLEMIDRGFDPIAHTWNESPKYAIGMVQNLAFIAAFVDEMYSISLIDERPIIIDAIMRLPEYLFPNGFTTAFGDSVYQQLPMHGAIQLQKLLQRRGRARDASRVADLVAAMQLAGFSGNGPGYSELCFPKDASSAASRAIHAFMSRSFHSGGSGFLVQRAGIGPRNALMVVQYSSTGNHMHSNGISMELYGKGIVISPCSGMGSSFFQQDYLEYYSQFPAHNTVVVDGISAYPQMRSNHGFSVRGCYPAVSDASKACPWFTYSRVYMREPETDSDQERVMGIVRLHDTAGFYVDVFRSRRRDSQDKKHEYFYQNIGDKASVISRDGSYIEMAETDELCFAKGDLFAYDYLFDKYCARYSDDFRVVFEVSRTQFAGFGMQCWIAGGEGRSIFTARAPRSTALDGAQWCRNKMISDEIAAMPMQKLVVRQDGEAWERPFVAVFEPFSPSQPPQVLRVDRFIPCDAPKDFVGLSVYSASGAVTYIGTSAEICKMPVSTGSCVSDGSYVLVSESGGQLRNFFGHNCRLFSCPGFSVRSLNGVLEHVVFSQETDGMYYSASGDISVSLPRRNAEVAPTLLLERDGLISEHHPREVVTPCGPEWVYTLPCAKFLRIAGLGFGNETVTKYKVDISADQG